MYWPTTAAEPMNSDPASLQNLNDIVAPGALPWWPPAPGWYVVAVVLVLLALWGSVRLFRHWRANAYRREAIRIFSDLQAGGVEQAGELPGLLKRTALAAWPRQQVAALSGAEWHDFLDRTASTERFSRSAGTLLERLAYPENGAPRLSAEEYRLLNEAAAHWLRHHRVKVD